LHSLEKTPIVNTFIYLLSFLKYEDKEEELAYVLLKPLKGGSRSDIIPPSVRYPIIA